jgi:DNA-directed RNA polymerase specialized sigma subunit
MLVDKREGWMRYERQKQEHASHRQRDMAIYRYVVAGQLSHREIGAKYSLSAARVSQIAARIAEERTKK